MSMYVHMLYPCTLHRVAPLSHSTGRSESIVHIGLKVRRERGTEKEKKSRNGVYVCAKSSLRLWVLQTEYLYLYLYLQLLMGANYVRVKENGDGLGNYVHEYGSEIAEYGAD